MGGTGDEPFELVHRLGLAALAVASGDLDEGSAQFPHHELDTRLSVASVAQQAHDVVAHGVVPGLPGSHVVERLGHPRRHFGVGRPPVSAVITS